MEPDFVLIIRIFSLIVVLKFDAAYFYVNIEARPDIKKKQI